jgi:hypothetical protein
MEEEAGSNQNDTSNPLKSNSGQNRENRRTYFHTETQLLGAGQPDQFRVVGLANLDPALGLEDPKIDTASPG